MVSELYEEQDSIERAREHLALADLALTECLPDTARAAALIDKAGSALESRHGLAVNPHRGMLEFNQVIERLDMSTVPDELYEDFDEWRAMTPTERIAAGRESGTMLEFRQPLNFGEVRDWIDLMTVPNHISW